jgi:DNA-binding CsgD family transcriptional regulator
MSSTRFVGRQVELGLLESVCSKAKADEMPAAAVVSGPPGSGKSRLLSELGRRNLSARQLRVAGFEAGMNVPLAAAGDMLRDLGKVLGAGAMLNELLFEPRGSKDRSLEPLRVFEAARQALLGIADLVLLAIDDVQWIDELSAALCFYLVRSTVAEQKALAVIAASRQSTEAMVFRESLTRELGDDRVTTVELNPLDKENGLQLIRQLAPRLSQDEAVEIWSQAKGSPFWLGMLARGKEGADVADYIASRLRALRGDGASLLTVLGVITRPLAVSELAALWSWDEPRCESAASELERSGLAVKEGQSLRLAHDLIRASVMAEMPATRLREVHSALASWFEQQAEADVELLHEALVHRRAAGLDITNLALRVLQSPRRRLLGRAGLQELAAIADSEGLDEPVAVALRLAVAELAGDVGEQQVALDRWTALASNATDPTLRATAYLAASRAAVHILERQQEAPRLLELAQSQLADDPVLAVEIESHRANLLQVVLRQAEEGRRAAFRAAETARQLWGQPPVELTARERDAYVAALQVAFNAAVVEEDGAEQVRIADELGRGAWGSEEAAVWADHDRAAALMFAGRVGEALDSGRRAWMRARERMLPMLVFTSGTNLLSKLLEASRLDEADEVITECLELERRLAGESDRFAMSKVGDWSIHSLRHEAWLSRGDWRDAIGSLEREITRQREPHFRMHLHQSIFVWLARCAGQTRSQEIELHVAASGQDSIAAGCRRCSREHKLKAAEAFARLGRIEEAQGQLEGWDEDGRDAVRNDALWRHHVAALVAVARHEPSGIAELESVVAERRRLGLVASLLWTRLDLAAALQTHDSHRAAEEFRHAGELAAAVGASTEQQIADLGLRRLGVRTWRRGKAKRSERALDTLSERERQIATLIAAGHSNPEIASRLFLSRKTIERHVSNILARTGTRNRTELARFLSAQELGSTAG